MPIDAPARPVTGASGLGDDPTPDEPTGLRGPLGGWRAAAASVADQGVASLSNIVVLILVARSASATGFGTFSLAYMVAAVLMGASASYVAQPMVLRTGDDIRGAARSALLAVAGASLALGVLGVGVLVWLTGPSAVAFLVLAAVLPIVLTQDITRFCFAALRRPQLALASDLLWLACVVPAVLVQPADSSPARWIAVWGLSAVPALVLALVLLRAQVKGAALDLRPLVRRGYLGRRFVIEYAAGNASGQLSVIGLGAVASPLAVGAMRGSSTLLGPMNVLLSAVSGFAPPHLTRLTGARERAHAAFRLGLGLFVVASLWGGALLLLPDAAGRQVLGDTWANARPVLPAMVCQYLAMSFSTAGAVALRVLRPRATLPIQVPFSIASVVLLFVGYALGGVVGAAWGLVIGAVGKTLMTWWRVRSVSREVA